MLRIVHYLGGSGSYPAARDFSQLIADAYTEVIPTGPSTLRRCPPATKALLFAERCAVLSGDYADFVLNITTF